MTKSEAAEGMYKGGFNCASSVLSAFCEEYDLDMETALKLACGLGGGFGLGEICGAASAGILVVGLKHGQAASADQGAKTNCYGKTLQFIDLFTQKHGALTCRDLLADKTDSGGTEDISERRRFCAGVVKGAAEILEELGY